MDEDWSEYAEIWDRDEDARFFADEAFASLSELVTLSAEGETPLRVLDFGCGTGLLGERLAPHVGEVVAVDVSEEMLAVLRAKKLDNVVIHCVDIHDEPVREAGWLAGFDVVVASAVCGELPDYPRTIARLAQALKPGGHLLQWDWIASEDDDDDGLTLEAVAAAMRGAGLEVVLVDHAFDVTFGDDDVPVLIGVGRKPC